MPRLIRVEKAAPASAEVPGVLRRILPPGEGPAEYFPFVSLVERWVPAEGPASERREEGVEGLTLVLAGTVEHEDDAGARHLLRPGDAQWVTAASGFASRRTARDGQQARLLELRIDLPEGSLPRPGAQLLPQAALPVAIMRKTRVRVIAGHHQGRSGPARTLVPVTCLDVAMPEAGYLVHGVPAGRRVIVCVLEGAAEIEGAVALAGELALVQCEGNPFRIGSASGARFLLLHGPASRTPAG